MAHKNRKYNPKERPRTIDQQIVNMRWNFPSFECRRFQNNKAEWIGMLQPMTLFNIYRVKIECQVSSRPNVFVISPALVLESHGNKLTHIYSPNQPCIYSPRSDEWTGTKFIADTIVPWAVLWLFYYEIWLATGEWCGGGVHPEKRIPYRKMNDKDMVIVG